MTDMTNSDIRWAKVEIMGHRTRCGVVREVEEFGAKLCEISVYAGDATEPVVERYSGAALFSITPCSEVDARAYHQPWDYRRPVAAIPHDSEPVDVPFEDDATPTTQAED